MRFRTVERHTDKPSLAVLVAGKDRLLADITEKDFLKDIIRIGSVLRSRIGEPIDKVTVCRQNVFCVRHPLSSFPVFYQQYSPEPRNATSNPPKTEKIFVCRFAATATNTFYDSQIPLILWLLLGSFS